MTASRPYRLAAATLCGTTPEPMLLPAAMLRSAP